jgi:beta-glucosidase
MTRPCKELAGFARVELAPGEEKEVRFTVEPSQMAFVDEDMRWKIEKGEFGVELGSSSDDIRLTGSYKVTKDAWLEGRSRAFCAKAQIL